MVDPADWDATNYVDTPNGLEVANDDHWPSDLIDFNNYFKANAGLRPDADVDASATDDAEENTRSALLPPLPVLHSDSNAMLPPNDDSNIFDSLTAIVNEATADGNVDVATALQTAATRDQSWMGEQPLKCYRGGCCYIASDKKDLIAHRITHSPGEKYTCDFNECNYASAQQAL